MDSVNLTRHYSEDEFSYSSFFNSNYVDISLRNSSMFLFKLFIKGDLENKLKLPKSDIKIMKPKLMKQDYIMQFCNDVDNCITGLIKDDVDETILYNMDKITIKYDGKELYDLDFKIFGLEDLAPGVVFKIKYYKTLERTDIEVVLGCYTEKYYTVWCTDKLLIINNTKEHELQIMDREKFNMIILVSYEENNTITGNYRITRLTNYKMNYSIEYEYDNLGIINNIKSSSARIESSFSREKKEYDTGYTSITLKYPLIVDKLFCEFFINPELDIFITRRYSIFNGIILSVYDEASSEE